MSAINYTAWLDSAKYLANQGVEHLKSSTPQQLVAYAGVGLAGFAALYSVTTWVKYGLRKLPPRLSYGKLNANRDNVPAPTVRRVAVVGGSGSLGGVIVQHLVAVGSAEAAGLDGNEQYTKLGVKEFDEVVVIDMAPSRFQHKKIVFKRVDITQLAHLKKALEGCTHVIHTAAIIDLRENPIQKTRAKNINVVGTFNVMQACINLGIKSLVYTSSAILGMSKDGPWHCETDEDMYERSKIPLAIDITYRRTKTEATHLVLNANGTGGTHTAALAFFLAYGSGSITDIIWTIDGGIFFFSNPEAGSNSCIYIESLARSHVLALDGLEKRPEKVGGQFFIVGDTNQNFFEFSEHLWTKCGRPGKPPYRFWLGQVLLRVGQFYDFLTHGFSNNPLVNFFSPSGDRVARSPITYGPCTKAQTLLGWVPTPVDVGVDKAIAETKRRKKKAN